MNNVKTLTITLALAALTITAAAQTSNNPFTVPSQRPAQAPGTTPPTTAGQVGGVLNPFPPMNPKLFTASSPTMATVESFLSAMWGYEPSRIWNVAGIEKTNVPGIVKITVLLADRAGNGGLQKAVFFVTPDGKHVIGSDILPFGAQPFAEARKLMLDRADGPARGAASKDLLVVEFADLQCPSCKAAQPAIQQLMRDYPQARVVFEDAPQEATHPVSADAAAYGVCMAQKGDAAFFSFVQAVYDTQDTLSATGRDTALKTAAAKVGQDPEAIATCAASPATRSAVQATEDLAAAIGITQTPSLVINGRIVPLAGISYEVLEKVLRHQAEMDGVALPAPQPKLQSLQ